MTDPELPHDDLASPALPTPPAQPLAPSEPPLAPAPASLEAAPVPAAAPPVAPSPSGGGLLELLTLRRAEAEIVRQIEARSLTQRQRAQRARVAAELAERALEPIDPLRNGSGVPLAISLYREAAYWALLAQNERAQAADLAGAMQAVDRPVVERAAGGAERLEVLRQGLAASDFVVTADWPPEEQLALAQQARLFVLTLLDRLEGAERRLGLVKLSRWSRLLTLLAVTVALMVALVAGIQRATQGPDLAAGKPWRASSSYGGFNPQTHMVDGNESRIFFHTQEEEGPWVEIDLGSVMTVGSVEIVNRGDNFQGRAVPTVIELSSDRNVWNEVARRGTTYTTWKASFSPRPARYVRVKAAARTWLHLEKVAVRAK